MKIKYYAMRAALAVMFASLNSFAGSLVVEKDYTQIYIVKGSMTFTEGLSMSAGCYSSNSATFLTYNPESDPNVAPYFIAKLEDLLGRENRLYMVSMTIKGKKLEVYFEIDQTGCLDGEKCMFEKDNIQDFHCKIVEATLDGVESARGLNRRMDL